MPICGKVVQCEVCHQAAGGRDVGGKFQHVATGVDHPASGKLAGSRRHAQAVPALPRKDARQTRGTAPDRIATHAGNSTMHHLPQPAFAQDRRDGRCTGSADRGKLGVAKPRACAGCHGGDRREHQSGLAESRWPKSRLPRRSAQGVQAWHAAERHDVGNGKEFERRGDAEISPVITPASRRESPEPRSRQDVAAGKAKAAACAACHGANGVSNNPAWPSLAGQQKDYLLAALKAYKDGTRKNEMMAGMAKGLSDADMEALALYFSNATMN